ncbi:hypothetical protein PF005_g27650 [Phytophthora fragariae]|uniref:Uncharacterized protein n=1 Tax=Phytophthora fragariae TaxID=53985 RepID=A0A6A3FA27_9STRA|nr:hypothetical protein PF003_g960 [Phytophthora fragariae]KAE8942655.1 hypothetical protein PF009_g7597 [Phytophthora fragariae]KAE9022226.1 hypothetical protein PF011_g4568 [Phytophthora fragariae]KAE9067616.1 hypothetical protein PF010_g27393 [Phytophthora fragariae]KAE9123428.1 hypothetical protein PF007_g7065 [Phytophthora fragariae]
MWGSVVLAFFLLDRSSELWGPVVSDKLTGVVQTRESSQRHSTRQLRNTGRT